ncbi:hypothetical protein ACFVAF_38955, partial [Streptomyces sp. NPDC057596]
MGCKIEPDDLSGDVHRYRVPESGTRIFVIDDPPGPGICRSRCGRRGRAGRRRLLYESTPGATYKGIAADLGINRNTLRAWVLRD